MGNCDFLYRQRFVADKKERYVIDAPQFACYTSVSGGKLYRNANLQSGKWRNDMRLGSFQLPNGASLSYAEYGTSTGNPVLLFHGLVGSICSEGMEESLCGLPVRVIALARPGYGASDYFDMDCVADWGRLLAEFWDHLGLQSFDIVGISAGAPYAYSLAALYPDRIGTVYINSGIPAVCFPKYSGAISGSGGGALSCVPRHVTARGGAGFI